MTTKDLIKGVILLFTTAYILSHILSPVAPQAWYEIPALLTGTALNARYWFKKIAES